VQLKAPGYIKAWQPWQMAIAWEQKNIVTSRTLSRHNHRQFGKANVIAYAETNFTKFFREDSKTSERIMMDRETPPVSNIASSFPPLRVSLSCSIIIRIMTLSYLNIEP
jgi:hypothetical protein